MLVNSKLTIYHKGLDKSSRLEKWTRFNYENAWVYDRESINLNKGFTDANKVDIRLPYDLNDNLGIENIKKGDIVVPSELKIDIETARDLANYQVYYITSINNNIFGKNKHIHLGGK